jgi:putative hydrolase of the HAD superfamily
VTTESRLPAVAAVLFDLDDTLLDRRATIDRYLSRLTRRLGFSADTADAYRTRFYELDGGGYVPRMTVCGQLAAEFIRCGSTQELVDDWTAHAFNECVFMEGADDVLDWCRAEGFRTGIITNGRAAYQRPKLEALGLVPRVDVVLVSGEEGIDKPNPELFRRAAERLGVAPSECVFVGDNPQNDVAGAIGAGMRAVWVERDLAWPAELAHPSHSVRSMTELRALLR